MCIVKKLVLEVPNDFLWQWRNLVFVGGWNTATAVPHRNRQMKECSVLMHTYAL
jgi:hypothetical protein